MKRIGLFRRMFLLSLVFTGSTQFYGANLPYFEAIPSQGSGVVVSDPTIRPFQEPGSPASIFASRPVDLRGIGQPDMILCYGIVPPAPAAKMPIRILRPQSDGSLADITRQLLGTSPLPGAVATSKIIEGDFNEDGRVDIFVACQGWDANPFPGEVNVLLLSNPDGTYRDASANLPQQPDFTHDAAVGDVNGDDHLDIYVGNVSGQQSIGPYFILGNGDGTFAKTTAGLPEVITSLTEKFTACGIVDIDGDGSADLVLGTHGDGGFLDSIVLFNNGTGDFTARPRLVLPDGPLGRGNTVVQGVGILDINRDGKPDLILPSSQYSTFTGLGLQILINQGGGILADESVARLGSHAARFTYSPYQTPRLADLNQDGLTDFYFSNGPIEPVPRYFLAEANGTFSPVPVSGPDALPMGFGFGVSAVSFDGTGPVDLVQLAHSAEGDVIYLSFLNKTGETPVITTQPAGETIMTGSSVTLSITAKGATPLTYQWRKGDTAIDGATGTSLTITNAQPADSGDYTVVVTNPGGSTTSVIASLSVLSPSVPTFTLHPQSATIVSGNSVTFSASATGLPAPSYQWYKNGDLIPDAIGNTYSFPTVFPENAGVYSVTATNTQGTATSNNATLTVYTMPAFTLLPGSVTRQGGWSSLWESYATGVPAPTFQWRKNGADIPGATGNTLPFPSHSFADAGTYSVVITNAAGSVESPTWTLTIVDNYFNWRDRTLTPQQLADPASNGASSVTSSDGLPNLLRYALGLYKIPAAAEQLPVATATPTDGVYTYTRPSGATDVHYAVEVSTDFVNWTSTGVTHEQFTTSTGFETWRARYPLGSASKMFFRLSVSLVSPP